MEKIARLKIAVNTRLLQKDKLEGIGWYTYQTLKRITEQHPEHEFYFFFDRPFDVEFVFSDNVTPIQIGPPTRHPILIWYWFEFALPNLLKRLKIDLFLSQDGFCSLRAETKQVLVVHDLAFVHYPEHLPRTYHWFYNYYTPKLVERADRIVTVSAYTKGDIQQQYGISADKIDISPNGCNPSFLAVSDKDIQAAKGKHGVKADYFIYVGSLHPRKNIARLLQAFDEFRAQREGHTQLVLIGRKAWKTGEIQNTLNTMKHREDVIMPGHLAATELSGLVKGAKAMVYVSLFEGFGIPILEAMYADIPVITSNVSSMPEVAGDAAILVDPLSVNNIADGLLQIHDHPELREQLIEKGKAQRAKFSWDRTAELLWQSIEKVLA